MASKVITIKVDADDGGTLKKIVSQLKAAGIEIDKVATANKRAGAAADDHHHRLAKGVAGVGNSTKSFSKMASSIDGDNNSLVGAYAALAANIFAVTAAFNALKSAAEVDQVIRGLEASGTRVGLTYGVVTKRVQETADGMLSLQQSARSTAQVLAGGFNADQVVRITEAAKNASFALGRDMAESMDRLTRGVIKLEPELLDELGIMVRIDEASSTYARSLGKTASQLTATEKRQAFFNATLAEAELKFGGIADAAGGASGFSKLAATFDNLINTIFNGINKVAGPLAALFATSPLALLGGMALFASSIKGQLMPGLVNSSRELAKNAEAASQVALANIANISSSAQWSKNLGDLAENARLGTLTLDDLNKKQTELENKRGEILDTRPYMGDDGKPNQATQGMLKNNAAEMALVGKMQGELHKANAANTLSNSVLLASNGNLMGSFKTLGLSIKQYSVGVNLASTSTGVFSVVSRGAAIAGYAFSSSLKVIGVAMLQILPWIGVITMALGLLWAGWKKVEEAFVGKEVLVARKELKEIMNSLVDKEKEYLRIRNSTASAFSKEVAAQTIITNLVNEQAQAQLNLAKVITERQTTENKKRDYVLVGDGEAQAAIGRFDAAASREVSKSGLKKLLESAYYSPIEEISTSAQSAINSVGGIEEAMKDVPTAQAVWEAHVKTLGSLGTILTEVSTGFSALSNSMSDFAKSATPTTPYDKVSKALTDINLSLGQARVAFAGTKDGAEKFNKILSGISGDSMSLLKADTAAAVVNYKEAYSIVESLTVEGKKLDIQEKAQLKNAEDKLKAASAIIPKVQSELVAQQQIFAEYKAQAIIGASLVQLAQARVTKLSSFVSLSASDTKKRMEAENAVIGLQIQQLNAQAKMLENLAARNREQIEYNKILRHSTGLLATFNDTQQVGILEKAISTQKEKKEQLISSKATPAEIAFLTKVINILEGRLSSARAVLSASEAALNNSSAALATRNSASALAASITPTEVITATGEVDDKKTAATKAKDAVDYAESIVAANKSQLETRVALGAQINIEYELAKQYFDLVLPKRLEEIQATGNLALAELELQKAKAISAVGPESDTVKLLDEQIARTTVQIAQTKELATIEAENNKLKALGVLDGIKILELQQKSLELQLKAKEVLSSNITAEAELAALKTRTDAKLSGRELTGTEERKLAFESAEAALDAALAVKEIKESIIKAEYSLLKAQYNAEMAKLKSSNILMTNQLRAGIADGTLSPDAASGITNTIEAQTAYVTALSGVIDTLDEQQQAALRAIGINIDTLREAVKASGQSGRLSGADTNPGASLAALGQENIGFNKETFTALNEDLSPFVEQLKKLGPDGEYVAAFVEGSLIIADSVSKISEAFEGFSKGMKFEDMMTNAKSVFEGISSIIGQIASINKASSDAKIANIDREIAAEQQRDGKSEASVARIKAMESKKDSIARKSFETNKKLMLAQAVMATAAGVAGALAHMELFPFNIALAGIIGAMGAAQLAIIAGTSYQSTASSTSAASPSAVSVGSRGNSVDLARNNTNVGGELGYLQGNQGTGNNSGNFRNRAYGGYGHAGMIVGEKGPELFVPSTPGNVVANDNANVPAQVSATFNINAIDAEGVEQVLSNQKGHIIGMIREAANANGQNFLERVNTEKYRRGGRRL